MATHLVALKNLSSRTISATELAAAAAALQIQVDRDFAPIWGKRAQIVALPTGGSLPARAWALILLDQSQYGLGVHLDQNHRPFAEIEWTEDWTVTASHELLEMLEDPFGQKLLVGPDIDPSVEPHNVQYLVEVADPCEIFAYSINGIAVSDFVTRAYYEAHPEAGAAFDLLGRLTQPFEVPDGCYLSWIDGDGYWHQKTPDGLFARGAERINSKRNLREDRDLALGHDKDPNRHRLSDIRARFPA